MRPDGKKKKSMSNLISKVGKLVNLKQNSMLKSIVPGDSSSDEYNNDSVNSDDTLME